MAKRISRRLATYAVMVCLSLAGTAVAAATPDAAKLMKDSDARHRILTESGAVTMVLQVSSGEQRKRSYRLYWNQDDKTGDKVLIRFLAPAEIKGTALLTVEDKASGDDQQWIYLPGFKKTRQVGTAELGDRFVNSDLFFEDLKHRYAEDYEHKLTGSEPIDGQDCWVIESVPVKPKVKQETPYAKAVRWLRKDNLFIVKVRAFDKNGSAWKEVIFGDLRVAVGNAWRADRMTFVDVQRKSRTVLLFSERSFNAALDANTFSKHSLSSE
jgi:hypothetical protein